MGGVKAFSGFLFSGTCLFHDRDFPCRPENKHCLQVLRPISGKRAELHHCFVIPSTKSKNSFPSLTFIPLPFSFSTIRPIVFSSPVSPAGLNPRWNELYEIILRLHGKQTSFADIELLRYAFGNGKLVFCPELCYSHVFYLLLKFSIKGKISQMIKQENATFESSRRAGKTLQGR